MRWELGEKLKTVSHEALQNAIAETIARLVDEKPAAVGVSIRKMDYEVGLYPHQVGIELTVRTPFDSSWASTLSKMSGTKTADTPGDERPTPPPEVAAWKGEGDRLAEFARKLASPEARAERLERALVYYRAALGACGEEFADQRRGVQEQIEATEKLRQATAVA